MPPIRLLLLSLSFLSVTSAQTQVSSDPIPPLKPRLLNRSLRFFEKPVSIRQESYGEPMPWTFIHLHDSEPTSLLAAQQVLPTIGGQLITILNRGQRNLHFTHKKRKGMVDPNRIFSDTGIQQNLQEINRGLKPNYLVPPIQSFGRALLELIPATTACVIALHNNTDGKFSIKDYLPGGNRANDARMVFMDSLQDPDDIVLTTDSLIYAHMSAACFNTIWQDAENVRKDGSLSVYCSLRNIRYVNIETQHGSLDQYIRMLRHLMIPLVNEQYPGARQPSPPEPPFDNKSTPPANPLNRRP